MPHSLLRIDIGVFAYNEAEGIGPMLADLLRQDLFQEPGVSPRILVLANGCRDTTAEIARQTLAEREDILAEVEVLEPGGKSRTWNSFVHELSRAEADFLCFCDADISLPDSGTLSRITKLLQQRSELAVSSSRPVKDILRDGGANSLVARLAAAAGGTLSDWKTSVCGQLYIARTEAVRTFHLPIGLPVEDGFVRAMLLTSSFAVSEDITRIDGDERAFHVYQSETTLAGLLRHQSRIVIGSAINAALFRWLRELPVAERPALLLRAAQDEDWLPALLDERLPSAKFGWVPLHFLTRRVVRFLRRESRPGLRDIAILIVGFGFDATVYVLAQVKMARGVGAGYW